MRYELAYPQGLPLYRMQQEAPIIVARFVNECLEKVYAPAASPSHEGQVSDQA